MTLCEYLDLWLETYIDPKRAENTGRAYRFALAHLSPEIRRTELHELTPLHLQKEINQLAAVYSRQAQIMYTGLRAALKKAVRLDLLDASPMEKVEPPEHEKREIETLEPDEAAAYIQEARRQPAGALLILMLCLGLRRNEARGLRFDDLDADGILHIRHQRTRTGLARLKSRASRREIPVPAALRAFFDGANGEFVVNVSEKSLRTQHLRVLAAIGVDRRITLHGLRHTCATMAVEDGVQLATVQHLLGHAHYSLTADVYVHPDLRSLARCTDVLFGSFWHQPPGARLEIV
ncbi:MAG: site-specific integrase [Clostridia bacterium]|nr:site-specific integrase [Clostridia bacterium]